MIDSVNLNIKSVQSFKITHRDSVFVFIRVNTYIFMCIYICTVFLKIKMRKNTHRSLY
jgi:hypothetical protein